MRRYTFVLNSSAFFEFNRLATRERTDLIRAFLRLEENPFLKPDFVHRSGERDHSVLKCGRRLVYYWVDHAVCEVRITDISGTSKSRWGEPAAG